MAPTDEFTDLAEALAQDGGTALERVSFSPPSPTLAERYRHFDRPRRIGRRSVQPHTMVAYGVLAVLLVVVARNCRTLQEPGHDWGDDFALYTRQAQSLVEGNPSQIVAETRFSVQESGWAFSPNAYPWGWPILLAPGVLFFGLNYLKLKLITTAMLVVSLFFLYRFVARRAGHMGALALVVLFGTNMFYLGWTNTVLSEFAFFASALLTFLLLDRYQVSGAMLNAARQPGILVGLALAWTMNVRREGIGLVLGLVVVQAVEAWSERKNPAMRSTPRAELARRLATPYITFVTAVVAFQIVLPTDLLPNAGKSGLKNVRANLSVYRLYLAEHLGLKDPGDYPLRWIHNTAVGGTVLVVVLALAVVGVIMRCVVAPRKDAWLVAGLAGHAYIVLSAPFSDGRYLYALSPWVAYFALQAVPAVASAVRGLRRAGPMFGARLVAAVAIGCLAASNVPGLRNALAYHRVYTYIENGPDSVDAVDMFANVRTRTRPNDIILFFRARSMMLYTGRRSVQNSDVKRMSGIADWYVMAKNSTYGQQLVTPEAAPALGLSLAWENAEWVLWRFAVPSPPAVASPATGAGLEFASATTASPPTEPSLATTATNR